MAITTRKLGQVLNLYESRDGTLMCQLLMKHAEGLNNFEGLGEDGEREISSRLTLAIEVAFLDENRCRLKNVTAKTFTVHAGDRIEFTNPKNKIIAEIRVKTINFSSSADNKKDSDIVQTQAGCATDLVIEFDTEFCLFKLKER